MDDRTNMAFERIAGLTVKQSAFLMEYAKTENLSQACRVAGINRSTGYKYLENEDFQAALEQTKNKIVNTKAALICVQTAQQKRCVHKMPSAKKPLQGISGSVL